MRVRVRVRVRVCVCVCGCGSVALHACMLDFLVSWHARIIPLPRNGPVACSSAGPEHGLAPENQLCRCCAPSQLGWRRLFLVDDCCMGFSHHSGPQTCTGYRPSTWPVQQGGCGLAEDMPEVAAPATATRPEAGLLTGCATAELPPSCTRCCHGLSIEHTILFSER